MEELKMECEEANKCLKRVRSFIDDLDNYSDKEAFSTAKGLREDIGKFLEYMNSINLIDRTFLMYIGYPRFIQNLDDIGISNMELLLLNIIHICNGVSLSLEDTLEMITYIN